MGEFRARKTIRLLDEYRALIRTFARIAEIMGRFAFLMLTLAFASAAQQSPGQLYEAATLAYERGEVARAISLYEQVIKLQPDSVAARTDLGVALVHEGRYNEGIEQYQEALKRDPENLAVKLDLTLARYKQGEFEKAASELQTLRQKQPENRQVLYLLADCYLRLGKNADAIALLRPSYEADPGGPGGGLCVGHGLDSSWSDFARRGSDRSHPEKGRFRRGKPADGGSPVRSWRLQKCCRGAEQSFGSEFQHIRSVVSLWTDSVA